MFSAQLITIGTEITSGEVVNTNASWLSLRLEELGIRVLSHLVVRDQREEILKSLQYNGAPLVIVTGGLGPTSDDLTRECLAVFTRTPLDFDNAVWDALRGLYERRGLPLREAHRWQCHFPRGSLRLNNSAGTALGFYQFFEGRHFFVLPGPPRELEAMWKEEVQPRLGKLLVPTPMQWVRWTCLGAPESEVAEVTEPVLMGTGIEAGYRAQVPYVRVKIFVDPAAQKEAIERIERALSPWIVARGNEDLAEELLRLWPDPAIELGDPLTEAVILNRLFTAKSKMPGAPEIHFSSKGGLKGPGIELSSQAETFTVRMICGKDEWMESSTLPYKIPLNSERGRRSVTEWALWIAVRALKARTRQP